MFCNFDTAQWRKSGPLGLFALPCNNNAKTEAVCIRVAVFFCSALRRHDIIMPVRIEIPDGSAAVRQVRASLV